MPRSSRTSPAENSAISTAHLDSPQSQNRFFVGASVARWMQHLGGFVTIQVPEVEVQCGFSVTMRA